MNTKQWAVLFIALVSTDYAAATFFGHYRGVPKKYDTDDKGYYLWSGGCRCNDDVTSNLDGILGKIKGRLSGYKSFDLKDQSLEEYEFNNGELRGHHKFERKSPYRCSLSHKYVRVIFTIGFFELLINYKVSIIEDILSTFLGGIGSFIGKIFGSITNFLFRLALSEVYVTVVLNQRFDVEGGFEIEGLYLNNIQKISFLNKRCAKHSDSLAPYIRPVCDHVLRNVFREKFYHIFYKYFSKVTVKRHMFYYETESGNNYADYNEEEGKYSYKTEVDGGEEEEVSYGDE